MLEYNTHGLNRPNINNRDYLYDSLNCGTHVKYMISILLGKCYIQLKKDFINGFRIMKNVKFIHDNSFGNDVHLINAVNITNASGRTSLINESDKGYTSNVEALLSISFIDVNKYDDLGQNALIRACIKGHIKVIELLLLQNNIDVDHKDNNGINALMHTIHINNYDALVVLVSNKVNNNIDFTNALIKACEINSVKIVKFLLKNYKTNKWNINQTDNHFRTAFFWACNNVNLEIVELLLSLDGINVNVTDLYGNTAISSVISNSGHYRNKILIVSLILDNINIDNKLLDGPLLKAEKKKYSEIIDLLYNKINHKKTKDFDCIKRSIFLCVDYYSGKMKHNTTPYYYDLIKEQQKNERSMHKFQNKIINKFIESIKLIIKDNLIINKIIPMMMIVLLFSFFDYYLIFYYSKNNRVEI